MQLDLAVNVSLSRKRLFTSQFLRLHTWTATYVFPQFHCNRLEHPIVWTLRTLNVALTQRVSLTTATPGAVTLSVGAAEDSGAVWMNEQRGQRKRVTCDKLGEMRTRFRRLQDTKRSYLYVCM